MLTDRPAYASFDRELRFTAVNDRLLAYLRKGREELIGRYYWDVYPQARGAALHKLMLEAQTSLQPIKRRVWSAPLKSWLEVEVFALADSVQVAFTTVAGDPPAAADQGEAKATGQAVPSS